MDEASRQFEVNVFGAMRLAQLVLPQMRAQHSGTIVDITSMGGKIYTPPRRLVPRHQVRPRSPQRLPAPGGQALRHRRRRRTRRHRH
ncbi:SDR family NAD(P)-dependent oxidoreductase [Streptomyces sp. NPDC059371]|uniref:SDR family NAD(P)-dependent oxidoreductase n=1 Tax=Streptomyces sp. NPDC059371 TaxID=3346812 RepID=UPI0036BCB69E